VVWLPWPTSASAPSHISSPRKPKTRRGIAERLRRLWGRKTHRERKLSVRQKSVGEISFRREEIVAIVTVIELGFIGIIIITITTSTFITIITGATTGIGSTATRSALNMWCAAGIYA
jgi:hypothetical protein